MKNKTQQTDVEKAEMLEAFSLFHERGLKAVKSMFPRHLQFVEEHQTWTKRDVKNLLFPSGIHA
jgi:hypothetical protein